MLRAAIVAALACALVARPASARPNDLPPLVGQVVDPSHVLGAGDADRLDRELEGLRKQSGHAIVVYVLTSLGGESIDDVAYHAFNTWGVGGKGKDDGVLIVVATGDRRVRIEVGNGVGGALTDLQANDIIRKQMAPELARGHVYEGLEAGVHAVAAALAKDDATAGAPPPVQPIARDDGLSTTGYAVIGSVIAFFVLIAIGSIVSPGFRGAVWPLLRFLGAILQLLSMFSGRGGSGGGGSSDDDRYRGGGGRSGGGGSSDSY